MSAPPAGRPGPLLCAQQAPTHLCQPLLVLAIPKVDHTVAACTQCSRQHARREAEQSTACCGACLCCELRAPAACLPCCLPPCCLPPCCPTNLLPPPPCAHAPHTSGGKGAEAGVEGDGVHRVHRVFAPLAAPVALEGVLAGLAGGSGRAVCGQPRSSRQCSAVHNKMCVSPEPKSAVTNTPAANKGTKPRCTGPRCIITPPHLHTPSQVEEPHGQAGNQPLNPRAISP